MMSSGTCENFLLRGGLCELSDSGEDTPALEMGGAGDSGSGSESLGNRCLDFASGRGNRKGSIVCSGGSSQANSSPSSSNADSLGSFDNNDRSSSGCSSSGVCGKDLEQRELCRTLRELKQQMSQESNTHTHSSSKSSTLHTLQYALRCVQQVSAKEEFYQVLQLEDSDADVPSYTPQDVDDITNKHRLNNNDVCVLCVSLQTGKVVYAAPQSAAILGWGQELLRSKFIQMLNPKDVSVFYTHTTTHRLPPYESSNPGTTHEKSFYCRISEGHDSVCYQTFRITPYLIKLQELQDTHLCGLLITHRLRSGYEVPRIPSNKRVFTTTHTPSCVFQEIDDRAVPLLGYLPQDLIGTSLLLHLHPNDRPAMLHVHRKIVECVTQLPLDQSSMRFRLHNGSYVTMDTSWSTFINPWSRKVAFVIGRHKIRGGPENEDVFAAPAFSHNIMVDSDIHELTHQIHTLLLKPVLKVTSSCHGSSTEASSSECHRKTDEEEGTAIQHVKNLDTHSTTRTEPKKTNDIGLELKQEPSNLHCNYQQISSINNVIRYLDSCHLKRKCHISSSTSSTSEEEGRKHITHGLRLPQAPAQIVSPPNRKGLSANRKTPLALVPDWGVASHPLSPPPKVESVSSQCSYRSTLVHVGDRKETNEEAESQALALPPAAESYQKLGLTKQVLAAHTHKEEKAFIARYTHSLHKQLPGNVSRGAANKGVGFNPKRCGLRKSKRPRLKAPANWSSRADPSPQLQWVQSTPWLPQDASLFSAYQATPTFPTSQNPLAVPMLAVLLPNYYVPQPAYNSQHPFQPQSQLNSQNPLQPQKADNAQHPFQNRHANNTQLPLQPSADYNSQNASLPVKAHNLQSTPQVKPIICQTQYDLTGQHPIGPRQTETSHGHIQSCDLLYDSSLSSSESAHHLVSTAANNPFNPTPPNLIVQGSTPNLLIGSSSTPNRVIGSGASQSLDPALPPPGPLAYHSPSSSCCSSPLNLLQLEADNNSAPPGPDDPLQVAGPSEGGASNMDESDNDHGDSDPSDGDPSDGLSSSSEMMDFLLEEDFQFGSPPGRSRILSDQPESRIRKVIDSDGSDLPQKPHWLQLANTDEKLMMTYQLPSRDIQQVLREDRERLRRMQKHQPRFTALQQRELLHTHPWLRRRSLPPHVEHKKCLYCEPETLGEEAESVGKEDPLITMVA